MLLNIVYLFLEEFQDGIILLSYDCWHSGSSKISQVIIFDSNSLNIVHRFMKLWSGRHATFCLCCDKSSYMGCWV